MAQINLRHFFATWIAVKWGFSTATTLLMNDFSWFITVLAWPGAFVQCIATAVAILRSPTQTLLPRWMAYFNLWAALLFLPSCLMPFFKTGPFAWNGLFSFWIPGTPFFAWYVVMLVTINKAIDRDALRNAGS